MMKKYVILMLIVGAALCAIWFRLSCWLMSLSSNHDWLSSFVEIAFALNAAITFEKIRGYICADRRACSPLSDVRSHIFHQ